MYLLEASVAAQDAKMYHSTAPVFIQRHSTGFLNKSMPMRYDNASAIEHAVYDIPAKVQMIAIYFTPESRLIDGQEEETTKQIRWSASSYTSEGTPSVKQKSPFREIL